MFDPAFEQCFLATTEGLWIETYRPQLDRLRWAIADEPYLPAEPARRREHTVHEDEPVFFEGSGHTLKVEPRRPKVMGKRTPVWCRTDSNTQTMYHEHTTRCFSPDLGLVSVDMQGRDGPSEEHYRLVEIGPRPAP